MSNLSAPVSREPWLDPRTGQVSRFWQQFLQDLFTRVGGGTATDLTAVIALLTAARGSIVELQGEYTPEPIGVQDALRAVEELRTELDVARSAANEQRAQIEELRGQIELINVSDFRQRIEVIEGRLE